MRRLPPGALRKYTLYILAWTIVGLFFFSQELLRRLIAQDPTPWWRYLASWLIGVYICAALTPGVLWLGARFPIERKNWVRRVALHLVCSIAFSLIDLVLASLELPLMKVLPESIQGFGGTLALLMLINFHGSVLVYWIVLGVQYTFRYYRRYQEREKEALRLELHAAELKSQLMHAHLSALKMQLQPHFLFNTLNAIMVLVRQQRGPQAEEMLARLSDLLRSVLEDVETQEVPLHRELDYLRLYLAIEEVRFQDRLVVAISANASTLEAAVPHMGLQPLVENAIRHGIGRRSAAGKIEISATRQADKLEIRVADDGPGFAHDNGTPSSGIGLVNTRARLSQLYGDAASLTLENAKPMGAIVTMVLPYHVVANAPHAELMEAHGSDDAVG
jgi:sensor histidine kinase YesM